MRMSHVLFSELTLEEDKMSTSNLSQKSNLILVYSLFPPAIIQVFIFFHIPPEYFKISVGSAGKESDT